MKTRYYKDLPCRVGVTLEGMAQNIVDFLGNGPLDDIRDGRQPAKHLVRWLRTEIQVCHNDGPPNGFEEWLTLTAKPGEDEIDTLDRLFARVTQIIESRTV